jgi:AraC-like DNA-binding protein
MPRLIDYAGRFDQMREAVFDITLRDGPEAISLLAVAAELQMSVSSLSRSLRSANDLPLLGLQWVEKRQRKHLFDKLSREVRASDALRRAANALFGLLPSTEEMAEELRVWRSLIAAHARHSDWAREARDSRDRALDTATRLLVDCLEMSDEDARQEYERVRALLEGVTVLVCDGRLAPEVGASMIHRHVADLIVARQAHGCRLTACRIRTERITSYRRIHAVRLLRKAVRPDLDALAVPALPHEGELLRRRTVGRARLRALTRGLRGSRASPARARSPRRAL